MKYFGGNCSKFFVIIFGKTYEQLEEKYEIFKKNFIMYKGKYGVILVKNCGGILKKYWKISNRLWNNLRKILRNLGKMYIKEVS